MGAMGDSILTSKLRIDLNVPTPRLNQSPGCKEDQSSKKRHEANEHHDSDGMRRTPNAGAAFGSSAIERPR